MHSKSPATSRYIPRQGPAHQRARTQLYPPVGRHQPFLPGSMHKSLDQSHPPWSRHQKQENYNPMACGTKSTNTGQNLPWDQLLPRPWVTRGECTAGTHKTFPTEGCFIKVEKGNQPTIYINIQLDI